MGLRFGVLWLWLKVDGLDADGSGEIGLGELKSQNSIRTS